MGEQEMACRANTVPFALTTAHTEHRESGCGLIAQSDRMLGSTQVFEGRDLSILSSPSSPSASVNGVPCIPPSPWGNEEEVEEAEEGGEEEDKGRSPGAGRRVGGETRLPGFAELFPGIVTFAGGEKQ